MERCNLQAMLKLVKLWERHSTNRLLGFDFTALRTLSPPSMISIRRTSKDCTTFQQVTLSHTCHCHKLRLQDSHALLANDSAAAIILLRTRAIRHSLDWSAIPLQKRVGLRDCSRAASHSPTPVQRGCRRGLGLAPCCTSSGGWRKISTVNHENLKSVQDSLSHLSIPVLWRPHGSL